MPKPLDSYAEVIAAQAKPKYVTVEIEMSKEERSRLREICSQRGQSITALVASYIFDNILRGEKECARN